MSDNGSTIRSVKGTWRSEDESHTHNLPVSPDVGSLELEIRESTDDRGMDCTVQIVSVQGRPELGTFFEAYVAYTEQGYSFFLGAPERNPHYELKQPLGDHGLTKMYDPFSSS